MVLTRSSITLWIVLVLTVIMTGVNAAAQATGPKPGDLKTNSKDGLLYAWIPSGTFTMGCSPGDHDCRPAEKPAHEVTITKGFWMGQTEVTQEAYGRVIGKNPSSVLGDRLPVEQVDWNDARVYCEAVGMRLPTEAEWEYAARGGSAAVRYGAVGAIAWYFKIIHSEDNKTHEVGQLQKNGYGLYDMLGNVFEWVADWHDAKYFASSPRIDPPGPSTGRARVMRGGCSQTGPKLARASNRGGAVPQTRLAIIGFRCAGD
jgi:formylglycine-generating enzyme required for sulfatase activity